MTANALAERCWIDTAALPLPDPAVDLLVLADGAMRRAALRLAGTAPDTFDPHRPPPGHGRQGQSGRDGRARAAPDLVR